MTEQELHSLLRKQPRIRIALAAVKERLACMEYKITPSYESTGGGRSSGVKSKVEDFVTKMGRDRKTVEQLERQLAIIELALNCPQLTKHEQGVLICVTENRKLAAYAKQEGIYASNVYKLRDKALRKAVNHITHYKNR